MSSTARERYLACRRALRELDWSRYGDQREAMEWFFKAFVNSPNPGKAKGWFGYDLASRDGILDQLSDIRDQFQPVHDWYYDHGYFSNVYDAALYVELGNGGLWEDNTLPATRYYFRGQTQAWPVVPSLYRVKDDQELQQRLSRLNAAVSALQQEFPDVDRDQAVAIAQHYSTLSNGVKTWLLDVTRSPLIALFFASDNGAHGKRGLLWALRAQEWLRLSGNGANRLGAIREIEVPRSNRIQAQRGLFLDTSHPQLFSAYSPFLLEFEQVEGLVFEDPYHDPPITREYLYQEDSELKAAVDDAAREAGSAGSGRTPAGGALDMTGRKNPLDPITVDDFREIVASWVSSKPSWRAACDPMALGHLCSFHARVFAIKRENVPAEHWHDIRYLQTLHTLWRATEALIEHPDLDAFEVAYLMSVKQPAVETMLQGLFSDSLAEATSLF